MRETGLILLALVGLALLFFVVLAVISQSTPKSLGLSHGMLRACSDAPNCVCSEAEYQSDATHFVEPMKATAATWAELQQQIVQQGGKLEVVNDDYLHATFSSSIFHYVDDLECRYDEASGLIHLRSASRVGHSDLGANRKRVNALKQAMHSDVNK